MPFNSRMFFTYLSGYIFGIVLLLKFHGKPPPRETEPFAGVEESGPRLGELVNQDNDANDTTQRDIPSFENAKILCWMMTSPDNLERKAKHVIATWWKRCDIRVITSSKEDKKYDAVVLPNVIEGHGNLYTKTMEAFKYVWRHYKLEADWFMKVDDDVYVVMENLRAFLKYKNPEDPVWYGARLTSYAEQGYMSGGAGYILSSEATRRYVKGLKAGEGKCDRRSGPEDARIGQCLEQLGVRAGDDRDSEMREVFHAIEVERYPSRLSYDQAFAVHYYPVCVGIECTTRWPVSFHHVTPQKMYTFEYLFYEAEAKGRCVASAETANTSKTVTEAILRSP